MHSKLMEERRIIDEAIAALRTTTGVTAHVRAREAPEGRYRVDAQIEIQIGGRTTYFLAEVKQADRNLALAQIKAQLEMYLKKDFPRHHPLLITQFMTREMAEECKRLGLNFFDTVGNVYLNLKGALLYVTGERKPKHLFKKAREYRATNAAGLRIVFALLCNPYLNQAPYREIAHAAKVALGAVGPVLIDLEQRRLLRRNKENGLNRTELINEWVTHYPATLRPKLHPRRYQVDQRLIRELDFNQFQAYWGGEMAAEKLTHYLKAEQFLVYTQGAAEHFLVKARARLAPGGNLEVLDVFWKPGPWEQPDTVAPPLLVYADLMATGEPRNVETARKVYEQFLGTA